MDRMQELQELINYTARLLEGNEIQKFIGRIINIRKTHIVLKAHRNLLRTRIESILGSLRTMGKKKDKNIIGCHCFVCTGDYHHNSNVLLLYLSILQMHIAWEEHGQGKNSQGLAQQLNQIKKILQEIMPKNWFIEGDLTPEQISNTAPPYMAIFEEARLNDDLQMRQAVWSISELYSFFSNESEDFAPSEAKVRVSFPIVHKSGGVSQAHGFQIVLERITASNLPVTIYPHPAFLNSFAGYDSASIDEMRSVWSAFCKEFLPNYAVRWQIIVHPDYEHRSSHGSSHLPIEGNSLGAALAVGLLALHSNQPVDENCYITGCVKLQSGKSLREAEIGSVGEINKKVQIVKEHNRARLLIPSSAEGYQEQHEVADRVRRVETVQQAREEATEKYMAADGKEMILVRVGEKQLYVDKYVVTVREFAKFVQEAGKRWIKPVWANLDPEMPATNLTVDLAEAYAEFYHKRLPTPEEWPEIAIAGQPRGTRYPWGNQFEPQRCITRANAPRFEGEARPVPVSQSLSHNPAGIYIYGNVKEYSLSNPEDTFHTHGVSFWDHHQDRHDVFFSVEYDLQKNCDYFAHDVGFRCVIEAEKIRQGR